MFCKYCGFNIDDDSVFCNKCGGKQTKSEGESAAPVQAVVATQTSEPQSVAVAKKPNKKLLIIIISAILLVATAVTVVTIVLNTPNTKITLENYNKIEVGKTTYSEVCELFGEQGKLFSESSETGGLTIYTWQYTFKGSTRTVAITFENNIVTAKAKNGF